MICTATKIDSGRCQELWLQCYAGADTAPEDISIVDYSGMVTGMIAIWG